MNEGPPASIDLALLQRLMGRSLIWVAAAFVVLMLFAFYTFQFRQVTGEQVAIVLNRMTGDIDVITQPGTRLINGLLYDFHVLDKTLQTLDMTEDPGRGDRTGVDNLKVKTVDGSDVYVDLKVQYRIDPNAVVDVVKSSGLGDNYKHKQEWARDYSRSVARNYLGELTTEEFYDSAKRNAKITVAQKEINNRLEPYGIRIDNIVIPRKPRFYKEYEEMIKQKKLADQAVLEEQSKALAAKQKQHTLIVQETNKKNVAVETFKGQMEQKVIAAKAEGEKVKKAADAYYERVTIGAGATLYRRKKSADSILARKKAEAQGIEELKKALEGEGGRNMVKMEYARKLKNIKITGKPFTIQSHIERFEHLKGAASTGRD